MTQLVSLPTLTVNKFASAKIFINYATRKNCNVYYSKLEPNSKMLVITSLLSISPSSTCPPYKWKTMTKLQLALMVILKVEDCGQRDTMLSLSGEDHDWTLAKLCTTRTSGTLACCKISGLYDIFNFSV